MTRLCFKINNAVLRFVPFDIRLHAIQLLSKKIQTILDELQGTIPQYFLLFYILLDVLRNQ